MIIRMLALAGGLAGAAVLSQYPEFAQQYTQRLAGQVEALEVVVSDFDATAQRSGLTREAALAQMTGTAFLEDRQRDMGRAIRRYERLGASLGMLAEASPMERLVMPQRLADPETLSGTWADFEPAVPLTLPGAVAAAAGYLGGWLAVGGLFWLLALPFRGRPAEHRPLHAAPSAGPGGLPPEPPLRRPDSAGGRAPQLTARRD